MLRCYICDYTHEEGSDYADLQPGLLKVRHLPNGDFLCDECLNQYEENLEELGADDVDPDEVG